MDPADEIVCNGIYCTHKRLLAAKRIHQPRNTKFVSQRRKYTIKGSNLQFQIADEETVGRHRSRDGRETR